MSGACFIDPALSDDERRARLYAGDIFVYAPNAASRELVALARELLLDAFGGEDPRQVHRHRSPEAVAGILADLKPRFIHHPRCKELLPELLRLLGCDLEKTYFDVPRLRSAYPEDFLSTGIAYAFHPHRDTWYSAPQSQLNWWTPLWEVVPGNAMGFYPGYFNRPVRNSSDGYNYFRWNASGRVEAARMVGRDTREQPRPQEPITGASVKYLPPPGGIIVFSGAHLHETVPNTSGVARYSIDFRTVHLDDARARRGALNVDSRCTGTTIRDYLKAADPGARLPQEVIERYDDGTDREGVLLYSP